MAAAGEVCFLPVFSVLYQVGWSREPALLQAPAALPLDGGMCQSRPAAALASCFVAVPVVSQLMCVMARRDERDLQSQLQKLSGLKYKYKGA